MEASNVNSALLRSSPKSSSAYKGRAIRIGGRARSAQLLRNLRDQGQPEGWLLAGLSGCGLAEGINPLHGDPSHGWTLEEHAAPTGMSQVPFATHFRELGGVAPMGYLTELRIGVALAMLRQGNSIQLVADRIGYSNASALSPMFAAQTGVAPGESLKRDTPSSQP